MAERERFDKWPLIIPKVGQVIQIQFEDEDATEVMVAGRNTKDGKTYRIWFSNPWGPGNMILVISPDASGRGMVDNMNNLAPYWRVVPSFPSKDYCGVKIYF